MADNDRTPVSRPEASSRRQLLKTAGLGVGALGVTLVGQSWASATAFAAHEHLSDRLDPAAQLHDAMRKLWEDHITWTRLFIVSAVAGLPDVNPTAQRLLRNQADIGGAVVPFYGATAGAKLTELLTSHILIAAELVADAKAGDSARVAAASARWYANANDIATFLSAANPNNWPLAEMKEMMKEHLDLTLSEALARLHADWAADIVAYDKIHNQILGMADMLTTGIIAQFPAKFRP